ncbi:hypothetical protein Hsar01_01821 [Haloferula sargassicola]|uniref:Uncharacterized protein n=2 Tax=Haloferula sargassicola TaxID=490096 RepID=A0ABP9US15_9BACT
MAGFATAASKQAGTRDAKQAEENARSFEARIPFEFWEKLKSEELIARNAPLPTAG